MVLLKGIGFARMSNEEQIVQRFALPSLEMACISF
jgi:hypothetical protein